MSTGHLMQTHGRTLLGDMICKVVGTLIGMFVLRAQFNLGASAS